MQFLEEIRDIRSDNNQVDESISSCYKAALGYKTMDALLDEELIARAFNLDDFTSSPDRKDAINNVRDIKPMGDIDVLTIDNNSDLQFLKQYITDKKSQNELNTFNILCSEDLIKSLTDILTKYNLRVKINDKNESYTEISCFNAI